MSELILIGTDHNDPRGPSRLEKLLNHTKPEILTVETSYTRLKFLDECTEELFSILRRKGIREDLLERYRSEVLPFYEWDVCKKYAKSNNIHLYGVDTPCPSPREKNMFERVLSMNRYFNIVTNEFIEERLKEQELRIKDPYYLMTIDASYSPQVLEAYSKLEYYLDPDGKRDVFMAKKIKRLIRKNPDKRIAHVGGALHMYKSESFKNPSMAMLLSESKVYFLNEADFLELQDKVKPYLDKTL